MLDIGLMSPQADERDSRGNFVMKHNCEKLEGSLGAEIGQQLLPGIPDEITIDLVAPKLPWADFHRLSSVSQGWQQAIRSRQIYEARLRSQSTQTLVLMKHRSGNRVRGLALYSLSENSFHQLPRLQGVHQNGELPWGCQCISSDGKVYVLGGDMPPAGLGQDPSEARYAWTTGAVYVLDLARQQRWKQCRSMQHPRSEFGCGVIKGKIYVFGGRTFNWSKDPHLLHGCEVYDPKSDAWSPILPMTYLRFPPQVLTAAEEFFVSYGYAFREKHGWRPLVYPRGREPYHKKVQVYDPLKNQWRIMDDIWQDYSTMLTVGGKLHRLTWWGIEVYDIHENSWRLSESFSYAVTGRADRLRVDLFAAVAVDDELLALAGREKGHGDQRLYFIRSQGFGCPKRETVWQDMRCSFSLEENDELPFLSAIQL